MITRRCSIALMLAFVALPLEANAQPTPNSCIVEKPEDQAIDACKKAHKDCILESLLKVTQAAEQDEAAKIFAAHRQEAAAKSAKDDADRAATAAKAPSATAEMQTRALQAQAAAQKAQDAADNAEKAAEAAENEVKIDRDDLEKKFWAKTDACKKAALRAQVRPVLQKAVEKFDSELDIARRNAYNAQCTDSDVLCLGTDGTSFNGKELPSIAEGEKLTVKVLSLDAADSGRYQVLLTTIHNLNSLTETRRADAADEEASVAFKLVASATSSAAGEKDVSIGYELQYRDSKDYADVSTGRVKIDHGTYYFEFGLGVPIVYHGTRKAMTPTEISESTEPAAAIAVLYFPWGRHKNQIDYHDHLWSSLGVLAGTDFDFSTVEKEFHLGLAYSPIQGLGVSAGLSLVPAQFLVGSAMITTNGTINTATHEVLRPYIGFFITTDFLSTASQAKTALGSVGK